MDSQIQATHGPDNNFKRGLVLLIGYWLNVTNFFSVIDRLYLIVDRYLTKAARRRIRRKDTRYDTRNPTCLIWDSRGITVEKMPNKLLGNRVIFERIFLGGPQHIINFNGTNIKL